MEEDPPPAERFVLWLHGLGDSGRANEPVAGYAFAGARWAFPTAPTAPVTCNRGMLMPSWFDIHDTPITSKSVRGEADVMRAVESVHAMIDREISAGTRPEDVFVFGLSQGGALSIASVLLYPRALGGCAVFSGFLPFGASFASRVTAEAKKTPVLWVHGRADLLVPIEAGKDGTKFLRGRLGVRCEFKVYDGLGHELAPYELQYCERWADGGGGGGGSGDDDPGRRNVDRGVPRSRRSCSCGFGFFSRS
ncbi:hypothetical protein ZWY2020_059442 [Hordeum vulgare]|nr:hypothetical protein ZWY2020_059442 [Hordeum vulgare]